VDNSSVSTIQEFTYAGSEIPELDGQPDSLLTKWQVPDPALLHLGTVDDLAVWFNGRSRRFGRREGLAWWDLWFNEEHRGQ
jgi:hypothetical protein